MTYLTDELRNFVAIPTEKAILSNTGVILQKSRTYFDNKPFGEVGEKALGTASAVVNTDNNSEVKTTYEFNTLAQIVSVKDPK